MRSWFVIALLAALVVSGCTSPPTNVPHVSSDSTLRSRVVIAVLDSGINPYVPVFRVDAADPTFRVPAEAEDVLIHPLADLNASMEQDRAAFEAMRPGELYHFSGTRLFAITFDTIPSAYPPNIDDEFHGMGTTFLAAREAPEAIIISVQNNGALCLPSERTCESDATIADSFAWAAHQPWIDVISVSMGLPASAPDSGLLHADMARMIEASRLAAASGKLVVVGTGNNINPSLAETYAGPPWVISVGGAERNASGESALASKTADVVSNFTEFVPVTHYGRMAWSAGTSLATPIVAGTLANALQLARDQKPDIDPRSLRDALNASAVYFAPTDWKGPLGGYEPLPNDLTHTSLPVVSQTQMGWGYVNASLAPEIARRVLEQDFSIPAEKNEAAAFQPAWQRAREEYWANWR